MEVELRQYMAPHTKSTVQRARFFMHPLSPVFPLCSRLLTSRQKVTVHFTFYNYCVRMMITTRNPLETAGVGRASTSVLVSPIGELSQDEMSCSQGTEV
jgi:hypothetical protein